MRFILFVEGLTEKKGVVPFLKRGLDAKLSIKVGIKPVRFEGWPEMVKDTPKKAQMHLKGPNAREIIAVIGLLDLYGPTFYPDRITTANERLAWAREEIERRVGHERFKMFFAVHEVEAWLLSQPGIFRNDIGSALSSESKSPEQVDFGDPPSKRLERLYVQKTGRKYKKTTHGPQLFQKLDIELAASKCPELRKMLDEMVRMAKNAGL